MSKTKNYSISKIMMSAQIILDATISEPEILQQLAAFGYDEAKLHRGKALYDETLALVHQQKAGYGEKHEASTKAKTIWDETDNAYMRTLKVARLAFKDNAKAQTALMLRGKRKKNLAGWIGQADTFYTNLLASNDLMARMAEYGYDYGKITAEMRLVQNVRHANVSQEHEKGNAREITQLRNTKLDDLEAWLSEFRAIARIALQDQPYLLKKLSL
jgi:hypothetical protein